MQRLNGIGVSPGAAAGRAVVLIQRARAIQYHVPADRVPGELERLARSRAASRGQLADIRARMEQRRGHELASLFDAQILILDDPLLVPRAADLVRGEGMNAEWAIQQVFDEFCDVFDEVADPYLRERKGDVADVVGRLRMNLRDEHLSTGDLLRDLDESSILVADELTPSLAAQVDWTKVRAFATDAGSRTYHTAILARSLDIPAVVGLQRASRVVRGGQLVLVDGDAGEIVLDPDAACLARVTRGVDDVAAAREGRSFVPAAATTADGEPVRLEANIEFSSDLAAARRAGAQGIGLYRSEFLLRTASAEGVTEDEQYETYRALLEGMAPEPVTVRTFDVDEEQLTRQRRDDREAWGDESTSAGWQGLRGLRLSLSQPALFETQLRALLRAARHGTLRIMFPFVSGVAQVREARRAVADVTLALRRLGEVVPQVPVGIMIEIPAAAYTADLLGREVDFFTIGTNDLIQYCLAVDRSDARVSQFYEPAHPAILRLILMVRRAAARQRIPVSLCGEMASDPALLALLVGLGLREFSMTPGAIGVARQALSEVRAPDLRALARRVMKLSTVEDIERELAAGIGARSPA